MINSIFLAMMASMGFVGFCYVTFYNSSKDDVQTVFYIDCIQFKSWPLRILNEPIVHLCVLYQANQYNIVAACLGLFYVYFPFAIILGFLSPHSPLAYTHAFIGDIVGMAVLTKAVVVRHGNVAKLLNPEPVYSPNPPKQPKKEVQLS